MATKTLPFSPKSTRPADQSVRDALTRLSPESRRLVEAAIADVKKDRYAGERNRRSIRSDA